MASQTLASYQPSNNTNILAASQPPPPPLKPVNPASRPYKDFLTPAFHRRFTNAVALTIAVCWAESIILSHGGWFWSWFPVGPAGWRTFLLFIPCLAVFIIRLMNMHVGSLITTSPFDTFVLKAKQLRTLATVAWYIFSAWFFGEVYLWTRSQDDGLGWVDVGNDYERPRVNENPIWLRSVYVLLALTQAGMHAAGDYDRVQVEERTTEESVLAQQDGKWLKMPKSLVRLSKVAPKMANVVGLTVIPTVIFSLPIYFLLVRRFAWPWTYWLARGLVRDLPSDATPTGLDHFLGLLWQAFTSSLMLATLWSISNAAFTIFAAEPPVKKDQPLTSRSKDPNGSLIRGLNAKKEIPRAFAFWELHVIAHFFPSRRKTIFNEVDRSGSSTWSQISKHCLDEIDAIVLRIKSDQDPTTHPKQAAAKELKRKQQENLITAHQQQQTLGLPKIGDQKVISDRDVTQRRSSKDLVHTVSNLAKSIGQSPNTANPLTPRAKRALKYGLDQTISRSTQDRWHREGVSKEVGGWVLYILRQPGVGWLFQQTFAKRVNAVIFGTPYSAKVTIVHAIHALAKLATSSLTEDDFGQVAKDVPKIVRSLTNSINVIGNFVAELDPSWTDVEFGPKRRLGAAGKVIIVDARDVPESREVVGVLKGGLEQILLAFGEYAGALGLSKKEFREAQEAVGVGR